MGKSPIYTFIGKNAISEIVKYCKINGFNSFTLVTDQNEYRVFANKVESALKGSGFEVQTIILNGEPVTADDRYLIKIMVPLDDSIRTFISVGSGTITDMTRFLAYRMKSNFISIPTAPSMDGYASNGSALTLDGMKKTIFSKPPVAIIADLNVLCQSPRPMVAAGFGDTFGKFTALADWSLENLLWKGTYSIEIANRVHTNVIRCAELAQDTESNWEEIVSTLTTGLVDVGLCMLAVGSSRPASGSEHSLSHFWEMKLMREGRPVSFHGVKVAYAATLIARRYELIRSIGKSEVQNLLAATPAPTREEEIATIQKVYGAIANEVINTQSAFLALDSNGYEQLKERIITNWDKVQSIAAKVPTEDELRKLLVKTGLPTEPEQMHLTAEDVREAILYGHFIRNPFTVIKLSRIMGINDQI